LPTRRSSDLRQEVAVSRPSACTFQGTRHESIGNGARFRYYGKRIQGLESRRNGPLRPRGRPRMPRCPPLDSCTTHIVVSLSGYGIRSYGGVTGGRGAPKYHFWIKGGQG